MLTPIFQAGITVTHLHFSQQGLPEQAVVVEVLANGSAELNNGLKLPVEQLTLVNTGEEWRDVAGYDGAYRVSSHGKVVSTRFRSRMGRERLLKAHRPTQYPLVILSNGPAQEQIGINRLVALHFLLPPAEARMTSVIPKDGNQLNLRWDNLRWVDPAETEDKEVAKRLRKSGADHYRSKLTDEQIAEALQVQTQRGRRFKDAAPSLTLSELAQRFGVSRNALSMLRKKS